MIGGRLPVGNQGRHGAFARMLLAASALTACATGVRAVTLDSVDFAAEAAGGVHALSVLDGRIIEGGLGQRALQLGIPAAGWRGGHVAFQVKVAPGSPNYLTMRFWGGDVVDGDLALLCDGKQVGDRLLSDHDLLDVGAQAAQFPGAFYYRTVRLPDSVTHGRQSIACSIEASGEAYFYGDSFKTFQRPMKSPSRGIYQLFVHTDPWFQPSPEASDGTLTVAPRRPGAGDLNSNGLETELLGRVRQRVEAAVEELIAAKRPLGQHEIQFLSFFRQKSWSPLAKDPRVLGAMVRGMDAFAAAYAKDPTIVRFERSTWNPDWFGFGPMGQAIALDPAALAPYLDQEIAWKNGTRITRRTAYAEMLLVSRDWLRTHRRFYTNQSMIVDCYGIYLANRGVEALDPGKAMPETAARRYLYEAVGLEEWRGDDTPDGGHTYDAGGPDGTKREPYHVARGYHLTTRKGLTRELGYVGYYGEVLDWIEWIYDATRLTPGAPGDEKIREQLIKLARARAPFRYPQADDEGFAAMRLMSDIGWRDVKTPGDIDYVQIPRPGWASPVTAATATRDPQLLGYAQQMVRDNQFWPAIDRMLKLQGFRATYGLLGVIDDVRALESVAPQPARLPMSAGQPDFAFADPEDGVIAIKRGEERLYASLYWRANRGVGGRARLWLSGPRTNRIATVDVKVSFVPSGQLWVRPDKPVLGKSDEVNAGYGLHSADAGEKVPLAAPPAGITVVPGNDSIYAGRGDGYVLSYGGYTVAMNMSEHKPLRIVVPAHQGTDLVSGKQVASGPMTLAPLSAVALYSTR